MTSKAWLFNFNRASGFHDPFEQQTRMLRTLNGLLYPVHQGDVLFFNSHSI